MKKFKCRVCILAISGLLLTNTSAFALDSQIQEAKSEQEAIQTQMVDKEAEITRYEQEIRQINEEIKALDRQISQTQEELNSIQNKINDLKVQIEENRQALEEARLQLSQYEEDLAARVKDQYMSGEVSYLDVLFGSEDISDFLKRVDIVQSVHNKDKELIDLTDKQINFIEKTEEILNKQEEELLAQRQVELNKINQLEAQNVQKSSQMSKLGENKAYAQTEYENYSSQNSSLAQRIVQLEAEMEARRIEEEKRRAEEQRRKEEERARLQAANSNSAPASSENSQSSDQLTSSAPVYGNGRLAWPVPGHNRITSRYGYRTHPIFKTNKFHAGIDVGAPLGTPITAADSGIVISTGWQGGYGNTVIVSHGNGISTLYAHNSAITVSVGDYVDKGDTIALCGSTGYSTGPHLHFEVRLNGSTTNPLEWL